MYKNASTLSKGVVKYTHSNDKADWGCNYMHFSILIWLYINYQLLCTDYYLFIKY